MKFFLLGLRADNIMKAYCSRLQGDLSAVSDKNVLDVPSGYASGPFRPMTLSARLSLGLATAFILLSALTLFGSWMGIANAAVQFEATRYETRIGTQEVWARGNVKIWSEDLTLHADDVYINQKTDVVEAKGNVFIHAGAYTMHGQEVVFNLRTRLGKAKRGGVEVFGKLQLAGEELEKVGRERFIVRNGTYSTCLDCPRTWEFAGRKIDLTLDRYVYIYDAVFLAGQYPAGYFPFLIIPVKTKRESGVIDPRFAYSRIAGFHLGLSYFWAMDESYDTTFGYDWYSDRGHLLFGEGRWKTGFNEGGQVRAFGLYDSLYHTGGSEYFWSKFRSSFQGNFIERWGRWRFAGTGQWTSDRLYTQEFAHLEFSRGQASLKNQLLAEWEIGPGILTSLVTWYKDIQPRSASDTNETYSGGRLEEATLRAPMVSYDVPAIPLFWLGGEGFRGLLLTGSVTGTNFQRTRGSIIQTDPAGGGPDSVSFEVDDIIAGGQRYTLAPKLIVPITLGSYVFLSSEILSKTSFYTFLDPVPERSAYREEVELSNRIGTRLDRVFELGWQEWKSMKHTIDVFSRHRYTPYIQNSDHPIFNRCPVNKPNCRVPNHPENTSGNRPPFVGFDDDDAPLKTHKLGYEIQQRLISKVIVNEDDEPAYLSFFYWGTDQDYDFLAQSRPIGPVHNNIGLSIGPWAVTADVSTSVYTGSSTATGQVRYNFLDEQYLFVGVRTAPEGTTRALDWTLGNKVNIPGNLSFESFHNFSQTRKKLIEAWYILRFAPRSACWAIALRVTKTLERGFGIYPQFQFKFGS